MRCDELDTMVLKKIGNDLSSTDFIHRVTKAVKASLRPGVAEGNEKTVRAEFNAINKKIDSLAAMLAETSAPTALLRQIEKYEAERSELENKLQTLDQQAAQSKVINSLTDNDVRKAIEHNVEAQDTLNRDDLKEFLGRLIESVTLNPTDLTCSLNYRIKLGRGDNLASPRGFEPLYSP